MIKTVSVYMGAAEGRNPAFKEAAINLGRGLMENGINIVYGGADIGLMKAMADAFLAARDEAARASTNPTAPTPTAPTPATSPRIIGVFPEGFKGRTELNREHFEMESHTIDEVIRTKNFGDRIATMDHLSEACIIFPGGFGTLQEMFSYLVNQQIGTHSKPVIVFNYKNYYNTLLQFFNEMQANGFVHLTPGRLHVADTLEGIYNLLKTL